MDICLIQDLAHGQYIQTSLSLEFQLGRPFHMPVDIFSEI
jgi:hypothetical protein